MRDAVDPGLVELFIRTGDAGDEEIMQLVARAGLGMALHVVFSELCLDFELERCGGASLTVQYDLKLGWHVVSHHVVIDADGLEVRPGPIPCPDAHVRHGIPEFVALYRASLGPASADCDGHHLAGLIAAARPGAAGPVRAPGPASPCDDLAALAVRFGSDKWGVHWYARHYDRYLRPLRRRAIKLLEIGVGGCEEDDRCSSSLLMWARYFRRGLIYGIDILDRSAVEQQRIRIFRGDQGDASFLASVVRETGPLDVVIDDGSHRCADVITSFRCLFPHVAVGGLYIVEDTQTSYWPGFGGSDSDLDAPHTTMGFLKSLVDGLNHEEHGLADGHAFGDFATDIVAMHFFHNLVIVEKGVNAEGGAWYVPERRRLGRVPASETGPDGAARLENI